MLEGAPQLGREDGVAALVLKPSALGGFERTLQLSTWARRRCWPSSCGLAHRAALHALIRKQQEAVKQSGIAIVR